MVSHLDFVWMYGLKVFVLDNPGGKGFDEANGVYTKCLGFERFQGT